MPKTIIYGGIVKTPTHYVVRHSEGEELVNCSTDSEFVAWCQSRVQESAQTTLTTFLVAALKASSNDVSALEAHKGKQVTLDLSGDWTAKNSQLRVK